VFERIPIIHLHGRLGYLPWQKEHGRHYGQTAIDLQTIQMCLREMRVVHEEITDRDHDFEQAKRLLKNAERVYLMGFGLGIRNVERLELQYLTPVNYEGTAYGLTSKEADDDKKLCGGKVSLHINYPCLQFLRNRAELF
jgi:hypothetical protein